MYRRKSKLKNNYVKLKVTSTLLVPFLFLFLFVYGRPGTLVIGIYCENNVCSVVSQWENNKTLAFKIPLFVLARTLDIIKLITLGAVVAEK